MTRQVPHVEDIATGTPTPGFVPVSPGPGQPAAWGAGGGGGGAGGGGLLVYEEYRPGAGAFFLPTTYPLKSILQVSRNRQALSAARGDFAVAAGPTLRFATNFVDGEEVTILYEAEPAGATGTIYSAAGVGKCLSLWNGAGNNAPPAGWETIGFNDSAWPAPVTAYSFLAGGMIHGDGIVWPTFNYLSTTEQALFRHKFTLTAGQIAAATVVRIKFFVDDVYNDVFFNGVSLTPTAGVPGAVQGSLIGYYLQPGDLIAGDNVFAIWAANASPAEAHAEWRIDIA